MTPTIRVGISTCPNDTFAFHGLLTGAVRAAGLDVAVELLDIEALNERMLRGEFDVCKVSFAAALDMAERTVVLPAFSKFTCGVRFEPRAGQAIYAIAEGAVVGPIGGDA